MKNVVILGATGSIGTQTLDVIRDHPDLLRVVGLAAGSNAVGLREQARQFGVNKLALFSDPTGSGIPTGMEAIVELATHAEADIVVVAVAGVIGLLPTISAIRAGKQIALASKEVLVAAGELVMPLCAEHGVTMTPIDSEHSALFQCMQGYKTEQIKELILTASGGPFRGWKRDALKHITVQQALNHPTWSMGGKITIDSATLMNKGLEMIEARWLFHVPVSQVKVVVHPQSIVHSFVKFNDGSVLGQLGWPNMRLPIEYALLFPDRTPNRLPNWDPTDSPILTFESVDEETFVSLSLARHAADTGKTMTCAFNAANEEAANAFLRGEVGFLRIPEIVEEAMENHVCSEVSLESLLETDARTRLFARRLMSNP